MLNSGTEGDHSLYFGEALNYDETEEEGTLKVRRRRDCGNGLDGVLVGEEGDGSNDILIAIQMDDMRKADLLRRGCVVTKK